MTFISYCSYKWCDSKGFWHDGYPSKDDDCDRLYGCDKDGWWYDCHTGTKLDGYVDGTSGANLIDYNYTGDPQGDRIDHNDAILPGAAANDDYVRAYGGNDTVYSGEGKDVIYAGTGDDKAYGGNGNDTLYGEDGHDSLYGDAGDDKIYGGIGNDKAYGGTGNDSLYGDAGCDTLSGDDNNDVIYGGTEGDLLYGGNGDDSLYGDNGADLLYGDAGNDKLYGGTDNDTIYGGAGNDSVEGGDGFDYIDTRNGLESPDRGYPGLYPADSNPNDDLDTVYGGSGNDTILTGDDRDLIYGGTGNDSIEAGVDDDTVYGDDGNDTIVAGEGADSVFGGSGDDLIYGGYAPALDAVNIADSAGDLRPDNGTDTISGGDGNDTIYGQDDNDSIHGDGGNDSIYGGVDNDTIYGDGGEDKVYGDQGADLIYGGQGQDTLYGGTENDTIYGDEGDDRLYGDAGNDSLFGGQGQDGLYGGTGNDTFSGGDGVDTLYGGDDRDLFVVGSVSDGNNDQVFGGAGGNDFDQLDLTGTGAYRLVNVVTDSDGNGINGRVEWLAADGVTVIGKLDFENIEQVIPCFTPGTLIATPKGEVPVESLRPGDKIVTRDNGLQEIRWFGEKHLDWAALCANPHLKPVRIRQGSLGNGLPERDMLVSPNHRMLVANDRTALYFEEHEVLVSAKHLVGGDGIHSVDSAGTTYIHFMFDRHEVVLANGAWTESFQPGDYTLKGMGNAQRNEILELFPDLKTAEGLGNYVAARRTLKRHEASLLTLR